jgi:2-dehydro-3-deoxyphosphogluconate aldolase / (4S)-4-hydroxy-2-oxoglutarate aldolase
MVGIKITRALDLTRQGPVIAVIVINEPAQAVPMAQALVAGGVTVLEITLRTEKALACIEAIAKEVPQAIVGAGTLMQASEVATVQAAGAQFVVSPGYLRSIGQACHQHSLAFLPGVATAREIMLAQADGHHVLKFFPATAAGGPAMLKAWAGPFPTALFCPTGGITLKTAPDFLNLTNVPVCGGSWLTPADALHAHDWRRITALAKQASALKKPES